MGRASSCLTPTHETDGSFNLGDFQAWRGWEEVGGWEGLRRLNETYKQTDEAEIHLRL